MGLDIYIAWDEMTKDDEDAQITGYIDAPEVGYFRASWPGVRYLRQASAKLDILIPLVGYHAYGGHSNGVIIDEDFLSQLKHWRTLWQAAATDDALLSKLDTENKDFFVSKLQASAAMVDFIELKQNQGVTNLTIRYA